MKGILHKMFWKTFAAGVVAVVLGQGAAFSADHPELSEGDEAYSAEKYELAAQLYRKDAELGVTAAQISLAIMYLDGLGVQQDFREAAKWFEKATEFGNPEAEDNLGQLYAEGKGVAKDRVQADKWFRLAGYKGNQANVEKDMTPEQIAQAAKLAEEWQANNKKNHGRPER
jgi:hypothetical protein